MSKLMFLAIALSIFLFIGITKADLSFSESFSLYNGSSVSTPLSLNHNPYINTWLISTRFSKSTTVFNAVEFSRTTENLVLYNTTLSSSGQYIRSVDIPNKNYLFVTVKSSSNPINYYRYFMNNRSASTTTGISGSNSCEYPSGNDWEYTYMVCGNDIKEYSSSLNTLNIPVSYQIPLQIKTLTCRNHTHILDLLTNGQLYDFVFDSNRNYMGGYRLNDGYTTGINGFDGYCRDFTDYTDQLYIAFKDNVTLDTLIIKRYTVFTSGSSELLTEIGNYTFNMTQFETDLLPQYTPNNSTQGFDYPSIYLDNNNSVYVAYYYNDKSGNNNIKLLDENRCVCGAWQFNGCSNSTANFTRICVPNGCSQAENITITDYCSSEYNKTLGIYNQQYETWYNSTECLSDYANLNSEASCEMNINIPYECSTPNVTVRSVVEPRVYGYAECSKTTEDVHSYSCNPSYDCQQSNMTCYNAMQVNNTFSYSKQYSGGESLTTKAKATISSDCFCVSWYIYNNGIKDFRVHGYTSVSCIKPCLSQSICIDDNYLAVQHIDCSKTDIVKCDYGCKDNSCMTYTKREQNTDLLESIDNPTMKFVLAVSFSLFISIMLTSVFTSVANMKENQHVPFLFIFTILVLASMWLGFIPIWIIFIPLLIAMIYWITQR